MLNSVIFIRGVWTHIATCAFLRRALSCDTRPGGGGGERAAGSGVGCGGEQAGLGGLGGGGGGGG